ncbi:unnamed protein product [Vitrella brassicaformis CCMP3155]|uniref:Uncharacterized protein n=1 Tax=Vitrella brassicaformis (strain CCMP3155) TaxID=1169540 RepID=A0A0G4F973_VITBC|nr:unnamed protein product [Vitrella brassicaformis CCMP3155]|eukprot:CEM08921.1 unnamed protein product [Vitrella brassicaformis CCMP3155]
MWATPPTSCCSSKTPAAPSSPPTSRAPDPTAEATALATTRCAVSLFSVCGAFEEDGIIKIEVPEDNQDVTVAGTKGAVMNRDGEPCGKVCIANGRLWPGIGYHGHRDELPADKKYIGTITNTGNPSAGWQWRTSVRVVCRDAVQTTPLRLCSGGVRDIREQRFLESLMLSQPDGLRVRVFQWHVRLILSALMKHGVLEPARQ